jgi:PAS domain S-box-containing protein
VTRIKLTFTSFSACMVLSATLVLALAGAFARYVVSEGEFDRANDLRVQSLFLADELRQSSDDLSRMAVAFVATGEPAFRESYREVLDIRDGRRARPATYGRVYWSFTASTDPAQHRDPDKPVALLDLIHQLGLSPLESAKLDEAKARSDALSSVEERAMELAAGGSDDGSRRSLAMLHDAAYFRAKAAIMTPIDEFSVLMERRTFEAVQLARKATVVMRYTFVAIGICLIFMLVRTYFVLRRMLGAPLDRVYDEIARLGSGDFSRNILVRSNVRNSVMGWLSETQAKLAAASRDRENTLHMLRESEALFRQLAESIREVFFLTDPARRKMLYVSPTYEDVWGRSCESLYREPQSWREAIHPDDRERVLASIFPGGALGAFEVECRIVRPDGSLRSVRMRGFPIRNEHGEIERIAGFAEDRTHRTKLEGVAREPDPSIIGEP